MVAAATGAAPQAVSRCVRIAGVRLCLRWRGRGIKRGDLKNISQLHCRARQAARSFAYSRLAHWHHSV